MDKCNIYNCNIYVAQKYIKHKWIPIIIYLLGKHKSVTFSFLLNNIEYISNKRLSESLKELLNNEIIYREDNEILLTTKGYKLWEIIMMMSEFEKSE